MFWRYHDTARGDREKIICAAADVVGPHYKGKKCELPSPNETGMCSREKDHTGPHVGHSGWKGRYGGTIIWGDEVTEEFIETLYVYGRLMGVRYEGS